MGDRREALTPRSDGPTQGRGSRGGGAVGATGPRPNFEALGALPTPRNFGLSMSFILFVFVFARELGSLKKVVGQIREFLAFVRGSFGPRETFASLSPIFKVVPASLGGRGRGTIFF